MQAYAHSHLKRMFGLSAATIRFLTRAGYIRATAAGGYSFQDLIVLRTVGALRAAKVPTRTINRALRQLKPWLSDELSLSHVSLNASGERVWVREGRSLWEPNSGQYALALEPRAESHILPMTVGEQSIKSSDSAHEHYLRGVEFEETDARAARTAYEACLAGDCSHLEARINLGRLLHLDGRHREAEAMYRGAAETSAILSFNLAVLLEDLGRDAEAVAAYREAIVHDPDMADAYYNVSLLLERRGDAQAAFRHLLAYRRLLDSNAPDVSP
jgi:tetratricopeptide (TPR) repeat protein